VAEAILRGKANKIIAYELGLRESTIKVHIRCIMQKLGAHNRTEVAYKLNQIIQSAARPLRPHIAGSTALQIQTRSTAPTPAERGRAVTPPLAAA
jgi:hypothetical protein